MKICSLYSGSSGNSLFVSSDNKATPEYNGLRYESETSVTRLMIDAGHSGKRLAAALHAIGEDPNLIDGVLLTHEHIDHIAGVGVMVRRHRIPLYLTEGTWKELCKQNIGPIPDHLVHIITTDSDFVIGDLEIKCFSIPHDAADPAGFRISSGNRSISIITDIGGIDSGIMNTIRGSDAIFIESNYDKDMLWNGSYPWPLKKRIDGANGHLSNSDCAAAVAELLNSGTEKFILSHLSQENNTPAKALAETTMHLEERGAYVNKDYLVAVARRFEPGDPWIV